MLRGKMFTATRNPAKYMPDLHIVRLIRVCLKREETWAVQLAASMCFGKHVLSLFLSFRRVLNVNYSFLGNSPASEF